MAIPVKPKKKLSINPITGELDLIIDNNFSYESIPYGKKLTIPQNHQMIIHDEFILDGQLIVDGTFILEK